jgi:menaquinone-9 beta-reductase
MQFQLHHIPTAHFLNLQCNLHMGSKNEFDYDVAIIGGGPAGATCALGLRDSGLKTVLFDKSVFPRDKICGDEIAGRAFKILKTIAADFVLKFRDYPHKTVTRHSTIVYGKRRLTIDWVLEAYTCRRMDFDNLLLDYARTTTSTLIEENVRISDITRITNGFEITDSNKRKTKCRFLVGADGAHSVVARQLLNLTIDRNHHAASVRAYFSNIHDVKTDTTIFFLSPDFKNAYMWVFPLPGGMANVGIGMHSSEIAKTKTNLRTDFFAFIESSPELRSLMRNAVQQGPLEGFGLPLGSRIGRISGDRFIVAGDAASLIDPATGDGIGNAVLSGKLAADTILSCFQSNDFSDNFIEARYDAAVKKTLGKELRLHYLAQRILSRAPWLIGIAIDLFKIPLIKKVLRRFF